MSLITAFTGVPPPGLSFLHQNPTQSDDQSAWIDPSSASGPFVHHYRSIRRLLDLVDTVASDDDEEISAAKQTLITEIRGHFDYLNQTIQFEWTRQQTVEASGIGVSQHSSPIIVQSGRLQRS